MRTGLARFGNLLLAGMFVLAALVPAVSVGPSPDAAHDLLLEEPLKVDRPRIDLGRVTGDDRKQLIVHLRNASRDSALLVADVRSSCGCTIPRLDRDRIAPSESVPLSILLTVPNKTGPLRKQVKVLYGDPGGGGLKTLTIEITADVSANFSTDVSLLQFRLKSSDSGPISREVQIISGDPAIGAAPLPAPEIVASDPAFTIQVKETPIGWSATIGLIPSNPPQHANSLLVIRETVANKTVFTKEIPILVSQSPPGSGREPDEK